jgi:hypothetical protein
MRPAATRPRARSRGSGICQSRYGPLERLGTARGGPGTGRRHRRVMRRRTCSTSRHWVTWCRLTASWRRYNIPLEVLRKHAERLEPPEDCRADEKLAAAVSVALVLGKPLLVADEPGTGEAELGPQLDHGAGPGRAGLTGQAGLDFRLQHVDPKAQVLDGIQQVIGKGARRSVDLKGHRPARALAAAAPQHHGRAARVGCGALPAPAVHR